MAGASEWSIITVTYNSAQHLKRHWLDSSAEHGFTWIVVDNGSTDGTLEFVRKNADVVIQTGTNLGFSAGNNLGLAAASTEYVAFVNPDVTISGVSWQGSLARSIAVSGGLVAPQLLNPDGSLQRNSRGLPFLASKIAHRVRPESSLAQDYARAGFDSDTYCVWVMGAALAGRTEDFRRIGGWDESYFLYYEDHEIGLRAWREGLSVVTNPDVKWVHAWQRETTGSNLRAWRAELASMNTFYSAHPEFLLGDGWLRRRIDSGAYARMKRKLWRGVRANGWSSETVQL